MGQVVVTVNGRALPAQLRRRRGAAHPPARAICRRQGRRVRQDASARSARPGCILLAALVIADELSDTNDLVAAGAQPRRAAPKSRRRDAPARWPAGIRGIAQRIESIAARLESHLAIELRVGLRGALGRIYPGADTYLMGAVPVGAVAPVHGAHLLRRATREFHADGRGGSARTSIDRHCERSEAISIRRGHLGEIAASRCALLAMTRQSA